MGFFDKARQLLGLGSSAQDEPEDQDHAPAAAADEAPAPEDPRAARLAKARGRKDRPPLVDLPPDQGQSVEDALLAREGGDLREARKILAMIDRGGGLRTVLRAAAALEAGDEDELVSLLPAVKAESAGYKLWLQVGMALGDAMGRAKPYLDRAADEKAPAWAIAWARAMSSDEKDRREGLVDLLFADAPLARTVAARDLGIEGAVADAEAGTRYAAFVHGRDSIKRFGAEVVGDLLQRAERS